MTELISTESSTPHASLSMPQPAEDVGTPAERAEAYLNAGLVSEASRLYEEMLAADGTPEARLGLARCSYMRRELHGALGHLQAIQQLDPDFPGLHNDLGVIFFELGLTKQAYQQLRMAAEQEVSNPVAWRNLIDVACKLGEREDCKAFCERLLDLTPEDAEVRNLMEHLVAETA